jgi:hypothetical protein
MRDVEPTLIYQSHLAAGLGAGFRNSYDVVTIIPDCHLSNLLRALQASGELQNYLRRRDHPVRHLVINNVN